MKRIIIVILILFVIFAGSTTSGSAANRLNVITSSKEIYTNAYINSSDDSLLINQWYNNSSLIMKWVKQNVTVKQIQGVYGTISPDGHYYTYTKNNMLYLFEENDRLINKFPWDIRLYPTMAWSWDSKFIYYSIGENYNTIYRIDANKGIREKISNDIYFNPVTVQDGNILFLLKDKDPNAVMSPSEVVKYNLTTKKAQIIKLPEIKDRYIHEDFTISPDGKILVFQNNGAGIYVINIQTQKIIDQFDIFDIPGNNVVSSFSWKSDGSYLIFSSSSPSQGYRLYKYFPPSN